MAVNVLGFKNTRDMTIMAATRGVYKRFGITQKMLWTHSVSAAIGAKTIASQYAAFVRDDAFICGLLHDVGKVILNNECPDLFSQVMMRTYNEGESSIRAESEVFGYTHTEVGSLITAKWNYPKVISSIIHQHHRDEETRPSMEDPGTLKVLACVDLSNTICKVLGAGYREPRETLDLVDHPALTFWISRRRLLPTCNRVAGSVCKGSGLLGALRLSSHASDACQPGESISERLLSQFSSLRCTDAPYARRLRLRESVR